MNNKLVFNISRILMILFMVFGVIYTALTWYYGNTKIEENPDLMNGFLQGTYILIVITLLLALAFPIISLLTDFKKSIPILLSIIGLVVLFIIAYAVASGTAADARGVELFEKLHVGPRESKVIGGGLILTYILVGVAVVATIASSVMSAFKK